MTDQGRVRRALDGDDSVIATRAIALDDIHIRAGGTGRDVTAYATVWMSPTEIMDSEGHYREQNASDAMSRSVAERFPAGRIFSVYNHAKTLSGTPSEMHSVPIGKPIEMRADKKGLLTVTRYNKSPAADEVLEAIRNGALTGMSYTGVFLQSDPPTDRSGRYLPSRDGELTLVTRQEIALIEYGPTPIPAYADAVVLGVRNKKAAQVDEREVITVTTPASVTINVDQPEATRVAESVTAVYPEAEAIVAETIANAAITDQVINNLTSRTEDPEPPPAPSTTTGRTPAPATPRTEPHVHSAAPTSTTRRAVVDDERMTMTIEERIARQSEVRARLSDLDTEYAGAELPQEARTEWSNLQHELVANERAIADATARAEYLRHVHDAMPQAGERIDNSVVGYENPPLPGTPGRFGPTGPAFHRQTDVYDVVSIRNRSRSVEEAASLFRDYAMRAVEQSRFPGASGMRGAPTREDAQTRVAHLLETIDDESGTLARRVLTTGSPVYDRAFGKMLGRQSMNGLTAEEQRALQLGTDASGGFAVPFQLDPTVILTSNSVVNPLRSISRVETITGKEWDGLTSAGVTVSRGTESQEVGTGDPVFAQPTVRTSRVMGWIPFSIELDTSWNAMRSQMTYLLQDAKDIEEATAFATGNGTAPNPSGVVSTLGTASRVTSGGSAVIQAADIYLLENAMAPRFIANSSIVASKTIFNKFRTAFQAQASAAGDPFARPTGNILGETFNGYPKYELSTMSTTSGTADLVMLQGDFKQFLIVDRVGMGIELVPQLLGTNRRPTGERGVFALWFNNSKILTDSAFRLLQIKAT